ncbi:hypothetical protein L2E82_49097 [Cichorium intybus]|uniref:Uncharacterized protein n=1 Tax=Cichorium intybus TaxID=13427 RepID=A0ACB8Z0T4_CICIN|nr:hypothetical protein L2E82_49097 [Cichorium intybus]
MAKIRDRTEDFKDAVNRGALSLGFNEAKRAALMAKIRDRTEDFKDVVVFDLLVQAKNYTYHMECERLHSVTSQFDKLRAVRFQEAINRAMPRRKPKPEKTLNNNFEQTRRDPAEITAEPMKLEQQQLLDDETRALQVELSSLLDAARDTETKMVEMSALNHLMSTHVLQQAQQIEYLYDQAVEATKNVEMGNKELTQAIQRNSSSRVFIVLCFVVITFTLLFLDWYNT